MVYIARFAKELKLDSISFQKLRVDKFSPLKEVIENTPGYHYTATHGSVYSDRYSIKDLKRIRNRIKFKFYTFGQIAKMIKKVYKIQLLKKSELIYTTVRLPKVLIGVLKKELKKKKDKKE